MLNLTSNKIKISSVGTTIFFSAFLSGCTGLAVSNKEPVSLVQGPAITDIFTPFDMALSCLKGQIRNDVNFSVGAILDQTGKDVVTDGGTGKLVTQGAGDMVQSALFRAGVSLLNRRDPRIIESEAKWGIRDPRMIQASNYYVTGSINSLDFIPGGGFDMQIGGVGPNYSQTRIIVGLDLSLTDARTSKVVGNVSLQKQIVAQDYGISAGRFAGRTLLNIQIGKGEREATNFALRQMLNLATFELLSQVVPPSTFEGCRNTIPPEFGRLSLTQSSVALYKYKETQQQKTPVTSDVTESSLTKTNPSTEKNKPANVPNKDIQPMKEKESNLISNPDGNSELNKKDLIKYISMKPAVTPPAKVVPENSDAEQEKLLIDAVPGFEDNYWSSIQRD
ncbi:CsgG/HfaB family protein [uncultured Acinetobacter sp.]|uniref:CsgG/HfaB family protein n=1 Tax=uncultured Acinetobacter sp. TaxID=165433 RepID=UPI00258FD477|nr:CsgG/HfaB family protein [uncultured Acinetobacter sp.]